jgi:hypothetical protein
LNARGSGTVHQKRVPIRRKIPIANRFDSPDASSGR